MHIRHRKLLHCAHWTLSAARGCIQGLRQRKSCNSVCSSSKRGDSSSANYNFLFFSPRVTRLICVALGDGIDDWYRPFYRTLILQSTTLVRSIDTETSAVDGCRGCRVANARYVDFGIHIIYAYIYICMYVCVLNNFWNITWCCISYLLLLRNGACETQSI